MLGGARGRAEMQSAGNKRRIEGISAAWALSGGAQLSQEGRLFVREGVRVVYDAWAECEWDRYVLHSDTLNRQCQPTRPPTCSRRQVLSNPSTTLVPLPYYCPTTAPVGKCRLTLVLP